MRYEPCVIRPKKPVFFSSRIRLRPGLASRQPSVSWMLLS